MDVQLKVTAYTVSRRETDSDPGRTAIMERPIPGWTCAVSRDLAHWLGGRVWIEGVVDVFAYHAANDIEINPCCLENRIRKAEDIRLAWAAPTPRGMQHGDMENFRRNYSDRYWQLRKLGVI